MADKKPVASKGKSYKVYKLYESKGGSLARKAKFCPKCGSGYVLAGHKDRLSCGKCKYTEFVKSK